jgi:hypothetical protein
MKVLNTAKLEELLVANWTKFLDTKAVMAFVLASVRDNIEQNFCVMSGSTSNKGVQITVSRFQMAQDGFTIWIDFHVPQEEGVAVGTSELHLSPTGTLSHIRTLGNLFAKASFGP